MWEVFAKSTLLHLLDNDGDTVRDVTWTLEYNDFNQLDRRYDGASWSGTTGDRRIDYTYDANGNLTQMIESENQGGGVWIQVLRWDYEWNPRDQMLALWNWVW